MPRSTRARDDALRDRRARAEDEHRVGDAGAIDHASASRRWRRRARSEHISPAGSARRRTAHHSSRRGYIARSVFGRNLLSFARYTRPPACAVMESSRPRSAPSSGAAAGRSMAMVQPSMGNDSGPGLPRPEALERDQRRDDLVSPIRGEDVGERVLASTRQHALPLDQPTPAEQPVPAAEPVERKEEGLEAHRALGRTRCRHPPVRRGGHPDERRTHHSERRPRFGPIVRGWRPPRGRVPGLGQCRLAARDHAAAHAIGWRARIQPRHRVLVRAPVEDAQRLTEDFGPPGDGLEPWGAQWNEPQRRAGDDAGEPHASRRGPEQVRVAVWVDDPRPFRSHETEGLHRARERTGRPVVLAVHIRRDGAADGDVLRARARRGASIPRGPCERGSLPTSHPRLP